MQLKKALFRRLTESDSDRRALTARWRKGKEHVAENDYRPELHAPTAAPSTEGALLRRRSSLRLPGPPNQEMNYVLNKFTPLMTRRFSLHTVSPEPSEAVSVEDIYLELNAEMNGLTSRPILRQTSESTIATNLANREKFHKRSNSVSSWFLGEQSPERTERTDRMERTERTERTERNGRRKYTKQTSQSEALFEAIEQSDLTKLSLLLREDNSLIKSVNDYDMSAFDLAVLVNNDSVTRLLLRYGAKPQLLDTSHKSLIIKLNKMIASAENQVALWCGKIPNSAMEQKDIEKRVSVWKRKLRLYRHMNTGYEKAALPGPATNVKLYVSGSDSLSVAFDGPDLSVGSVATGYKVEWSTSPSFLPLSGEIFLADLNHIQYDITGLETGKPYYVRVTPANMKGLGQSTPSIPSYATPSSWREVDNAEPTTSRYNVAEINKLFADLRNYKCSNNEVTNSDSATTIGKPPSMKKGIKGLFAPTVRFQKCLKRGVYFACVFYNEERILVTNDDSQIPILEVDDDSGVGSMHSDFLWFLKLSMTWESIRMLRSDMDQLTNISSLQFRYHLLTAAIQMQSMLGTQDLGMPFHHPIRSENGSLLLVTACRVSDVKQIGNMSQVKWQSQLKLHRNMTSNDSLMQAVPKIILFEQVHTTHLSPGLYLGYLKVIMNVESIKVLVPEVTPNVLPHVKIRDCPNVSKLEWQSLVRVSSVEECQKIQEQLPEALNFLKQILKAARRLAECLDIPTDQIADHRIYDAEVLEVSKDVTFIILLPPRDLVCTHIAVDISLSIGGAANGYLELPMQAFDLMHLRTYQREFIRVYAKTACRVHVECISAQQLVREAFSNEEHDQSKRRSDTMQMFKMTLESIYRRISWLMNVITYARDKLTHGVTLKRLLASYSKSALDKKRLRDQTENEPQDVGFFSEQSLLGSSGDLLSHALHNITNNNNVLYYKGGNELLCLPSSHLMQESDPGIIRVYAAYNCGLVRGTSVMLHVTPETTAREVTDLIVLQLNQEVLRKGLTKPVYTTEQLNGFILVVVSGHREQIMEDDCKLLQLQNPWTQGTLLVKRQSGHQSTEEQTLITQV